MATRGYQSYRGRNHGKLALVIVLVLILLAAVGYLVAQEYMVYDDEGHRHLELPFLKKGQTEQPQQPRTPRRMTWTSSSMSRSAPC